MRGINRFLLILLIISGWVIIADGQQLNPEESALLSEAQALYAKKDYQGALPLYAQLVSVHPNDPQFNYKYGVCTLFGDRKDKKKPIRYLNNAAETIKDDNELHYYLGMAYHHNQEFTNAIKYFNLYLSKLPANSPERAVVLEKINVCLNGLNLADKNLIGEIISTSKFQRENFHRAYAAQDFNGSLVIKPDIFVSDKEKKSGEISYVFLIHPSNVLYFSGYSKTETGNRDLFKVEIDENGDWGIPEKLNETINTTYDEDYPVLVDNGNTLYFCSKGHNSLGGYDIFRSVLDESTNTFGTPENLGPGINSPFDDIEFIPTRDKSYAYFASDRDNLNGSINVYKVRLTDNAFSGNLIFAQGNGIENLPKGSQQTGNSQVNKNEVTNPLSDQELVQNNIKQPSSYASEKASAILNDRSKSMALADSAFVIITETKELIRDLTNKRDRANAISQRKADEARTLEARFNESVTLLANAADEKQFLDDLDKSIKLKQELYQLQQRSNQANRIAWCLGNQVKAKNQELNTLKTIASKVQATSVTGTFEETLLQFANYKKTVAVSDTLKDFSQQVMAITNDKTTYNVPESELAFAENLKKSYKNNTLLAQTKITKPASDEGGPVPIVDKRTTIQKSNEAVILPSATTEAYAIVQPVAISDSKFLKKDPGAELLDINFRIDNTTKPLAVAQTINYSTSNDLVSLVNEDLEINFVNDAIAPNEIYPVVEPIYSSSGKESIEPDEKSLALNFDVDAVNSEKLVMPVENTKIAKDYSAREEDIEISSFTDKTENVKVLALAGQVHFKETSLNIPDSEVDLSFAENQLVPEKLIEQIKIGRTGNENYLADEPLEIASYNDIQYLPEATPEVKSIAYNEAENKSTLIEENLEITFKNDEPVALNLVSQIYYNKTEQLNIVESEIEINTLVDESEVIALINPVSMPYLSNHPADPGNEKLELGFNVDKNAILVQDVIQPIAYKEPTSSIDKEDPILDINFINDRSAKVYALINPVYYSYNSAADRYLADEAIDMNFSNEEKQLLSVNKVTVNPGKIEFVNSEVKSIAPKTVKSKKESVDEIFYLREAVMQASGIETNNSDDEILARALKNPDDLTYEELIYAANLTDVQEEKMAIYQVAFVHIDRDWRAFNNAGVSAIHLEDLGTANCYLYQASLLSADNGHIQNNMGILACHQKQIDKAEDYFIAASKLGYDAQYNLNLMNNITKKLLAEKNTKEEKVMGTEKVEDAVVDIIEYKTNP